MRDVSEMQIEFCLFCDCTLLASRKRVGIKNGYMPVSLTGVYSKGLLEFDIPKTLEIIELNVFLN